MNLTRFPRVRLTHAPTALQFLPNLSRCLAGPEIYIKRDDNTGLALGGNKTRKLEFLMGEALAQGATHIVTLGATQSNHVRQTIAAANQCGLKSTVLLAKGAGCSPEYFDNGNVLLDRILGASIETLPAGTDLAAELARVDARLREAGETPYLVPIGGSNATGSLGYVLAAQEIIAQANETGLRIDQIVTPVGSAGTQAGLIVGFEGSNSHIPVLGINVRGSGTEQEACVRRVAKETWALLEVRGAFPEAAVAVNADYLGEGYGIPSEGMLEAVRLLAQTEGILLDPVYTGKAFAGLVDLIRKGVYRKAQKIVFVHTGGTAGLFGYRSVLAPETPRCA